jgi:hypothetical protein
MIVRPSRLHGHLCFGPDTTSKLSFHISQTACSDVGEGEQRGLGLRLSVGLRLPTRHDHHDGSTGAPAPSLIRCLSGDLTANCCTS